MKANQAKQTRTLGTEHDQCRSVYNGSSMWTGSPWTVPQGTFWGHFTRRHITNASGSS